MTKLGRGDVRITTRYPETTSVRRRCSRRCTRPVTRCTSRASTTRSTARRSARGTTAGVHESQSRLWENLVGRSRAFWEHWYAPLQAAFPDALDGVDRRHLLSRDQQGRALAHPHRRRRGHLQPARDAALRPRARAAGGHARGRRPARRVARRDFEPTSASTPPDDRDGALQDVHWYGGIVGGALPELHARQHHERAVLRRGAARPSRPRRSDRCAASSRRCTHG